MNVFAAVRSFAARFLHRSAIAADMEEELLAHIAHRADDLEGSGLSRPDAERRARIEFGAQARYREASFAALGGDFIDTTLADVRFALRVLRKSSGFTVAAVLTLALAIAANAIVFGIVEALVLKPLNVPHADTLYGTSYGDGSGFNSYPNYQDLRARNHSFEDLATFNFAFVGFDTGNAPAMSTGFAVSGNYFDVLRVEPFLGRFFHAADERGPASAPYVVLTWAYWHTRFHDDPGAVGRTVLINRHPFTIVGVGPRDFVGTLLFASPDFFMPIVNQEQIGGIPLTERGAGQIFEVFGRLKDGITPVQAAADVNAIGDALQKAYPKLVNHKQVALNRVGLTGFTNAAHAFVGGLAILAALILLAACANLGGLFAAHAADRSREVALRLALGSSRKRILRQLLTEAIVISLTGGVFGLASSVFLLNRLAAWRPFAAAPVHIPVSPDAKLYVLALILALVSGLLFGIVPIRQVLRSHPYEIVKAGPTSQVGHRLAVRDLLLVVQIALCAVLVTSSMVAIRGLLHSLHSNYGFEPRNTMVVAANLSILGYGAQDALPVQKRLIDALRTIPGVEQVGGVNLFPPLAYASASRTNVFRDETRELTQSNIAAMPFRYEVTPGYFAAAGTSLLAGSDFTAHDEKGSPIVAIPNAEFARRLFGSVDAAMGRFFRLQDGARAQIIGIVENGKYLSTTENREPAVFLSSLQWPAISSYLIVRSPRQPDQLATLVRTTARKVEPGLPADVQPWNTHLGVALFPARMATLALGVLGGIGAILSITGIFAMAAYSVSRRLKELGIRVALGARRTQVLSTALGRALNLLALGSAAGLVLGFLASRVLASIVYGATPRDPLVIAGVILSMAVLGLIATFIPAQRALHANPMVLLREE